MCLSQVAIDPLPLVDPDNRPMYKEADLHHHHNIDLAARLLSEDHRVYSKDHPADMLQDQAIHKDSILAIMMLDDLVHHM